MEGYCSTGQSPQWAVVPMEEEAITQLNVSVLCTSSQKCFLILTLYHKL